MLIERKGEWMYLRFARSLIPCTCAVGPVNKWKLYVKVYVFIFNRRGEWMYLRFARSLIPCTCAVGPVNKWKLYVKVYVFIFNRKGEWMYLRFARSLIPCTCAVGRLAKNWKTSEMFLFFARILNVNKFPFNIQTQKKTALCAVFQFFAERGGFEPPVQCYSYAGLANRWIKPLSHLSGLCLISFVRANIGLVFSIKKLIFVKN